MLIKLSRENLEFKVTLKILKGYCVVRNLINIKELLLE